LGRRAQIDRLAPGFRVGEEDHAALDIDVLQNRLYRGDIVHQGEAYPGQHEAILDPELWQIVQNKLAVHRQERALAVGAKAPRLLAGLKAKRYRYYVSASLLAGDHPQAQKGMRVPAGDIEALVLDRLRAFFSSRTDIGDALRPLDLEARAFDAALRNAFMLSKRWLGKASSWTLSNG
jgi:site-specific DNA recombinase